MAKYPSSLISLVAFLKKFPGVGSKSAERFAFHLLDWPSPQLEQFSSLLSTLKEKVLSCPECHCLMEETVCLFCDRQRRDTSILCIISSAKDVYPIEETRVYKGLYHVIGGLLSPIDGRLPEHLKTEELKKRIIDFEIKDIVIALDSTLEGDATSLFLKEEMQSWGVNVSRLAMGLPMGSSLDYVDGGTLAQALLRRQNF